MKRINVIDFYKSGDCLGRLRNLPLGKVSQNTWDSLYRADKILNNICDDDSGPIELNSCKPAAKELREAVEEALNRLMFVEPGSEFNQVENSKIRDGLNKFETIFRQECAELATFFVSQKGLYSTALLIDKAESVFSESALGRIPEQAIDDINWSGRCIAFELPTAAGFHALRALEAMVLNYLAKLEIVPRPRNLGVYIDLLRTNGADAQTVAAVDQLRLLQRNPLMHPEHNLGIGEDIEVFNLCTTAITALVRDMEKRKLFPS